MAPRVGLAGRRARGTHGRRRGARHSRPTGPRCRRPTPSRRLPPSARRWRATPPGPPPARPTSSCSRRSTSVTSTSPTSTSRPSARPRRTRPRVPAGRGPRRRQLDHLRRGTRALRCGDPQGRADHPRRPPRPARRHQQRVTVRRLVEAGLAPSHIVQVGIADWANSRHYAERARSWGVRVTSRDEVAPGHRPVHARRPRHRLPRRRRGPRRPRPGASATGRSRRPARPACPVGSPPLELRAAAFLAGSAPGGPRRRRHRGGRHGRRRRRPDRTAGGAVRPRGGGRPGPPAG